jgi:hypothetical protein
MARLPNDPRTPKDLIDADLRRTARVVIKIQDEIDPKFRIAERRLSARRRVASEIPLGDAMERKPKSGGMLAQLQMRPSSSYGQLLTADLDEWRSSKRAMWGT